MSAYFAEMEAEVCLECGAKIVADGPYGVVCANGHTGDPCDVHHPDKVAAMREP